MTATALPTQALREQWGIYELEPGLRLWVRVMLPFVVSDPGPPSSDQLRVSTVVVTEAAESFKGKPSGRPIDYRTATPARVYESLSPLVPCESMYLLPNQLMILARLAAVRARRYADFAADRDPVIQLDNEIQVQTIVQGNSPQPTSVATGAPPKMLGAAGGKA